MQQTFPAGTAQKIMISDIKGDLFIHGWEQQTIEVTSDGNIKQLQPEGDTLMIRNCNDNLELKVPIETIIGGRNIHGGVIIENVHQVAIDMIDSDVSIKKISSNVTLAKIKGDAALTALGGNLELTTIAGDLSVRQAPFAYIRGRIGGDAAFIEVTSADIERVDGDLVLEDSNEVTVRMVGGDLHAKSGIAVLNVGSVGGDCQVQGTGNTEILIQNVGNDLVLNSIAHFKVGNVGNDCLVQESASAEGMFGNIGDDLKVIGAATLQIGNVGNDCELRDVQGNVSLGHVGDDATILGVTGDLRVGNIGSDASLRGIGGSISLGTVGSDLHLQAAFPLNSEVHLSVGGDARIVLPEHANLSIRARVGGDVSGHSIVSNFANNFVNLVYGEGAARLDLTVGNDLELQGNESPRSSSSIGGNAGGWGSFGPNWSNFGSDWSNFGHEMEQLGRNLGQDITAAVHEATSSIGSNVASNIAEAKERVRRTQREAEEQRRAQHDRQRAERERHRPGTHDPYFNVRINDREWQMGPERIEDIIEQGRKAAADGIQGALEAIEQALKNMRISVPPMTPTPPPHPGTPPRPPVPPTPGTPPVPPVPTSTPEEQTSTEGETSADSPAEKVANPEQEREAILRMIAEGRISPEEGDLLLEALG